MMNRIMERTSEPFFYWRKRGQQVMNKEPGAAYIKFKNQPA